MFCMNVCVLICFRGYVKAYIDFPKPLIAVINGPAVGVSVTLLGLFDVVYATERVSRFFIVLFFVFALYVIIEVGSSVLYCIC